VVEALPFLHKPLNTKLSPLTNKIHPSSPINPDQSGTPFLQNILFPNCIKMADYFGAGKEEITSNKKWQKKITHTH